MKSTTEAVHAASVFFISASQCGYPHESHKKQRAQIRIIGSKPCYLIQILLHPRKPVHLPSKPVLPLLLPLHSLPQLRKLVLPLLHRVLHDHTDPSSFPTRPSPDVVMGLLMKAPHHHCSPIRMTTSAAWALTV